MTTDRHIERDLPAILGEIAMGRYPDYIDDVLATTAQRRQRPAWTFPERWLPVDITTRPAWAPALPWRQLGVLALLAVLVAAMLALYAGSQQQRLPPAFGVAANGLVAYAEGGDIYTADPVTGDATATVTGPETDLQPTWSRDGTRVAFERKVNSEFGPGWLYVADRDGRALVKVTPQPLTGLAGYSFSPDGRSIVAFARSDRGMPIMVVASDGSGQQSFFHLPATADDGPPQYRPDGSEIMFIGRDPDATFRNLYGLDPASHSVRTIVRGSRSADIHSASWSPDGKRIAYVVYDQNVDVISTRTHVVNADGSGDVAVDVHPDSIADTGTVWSNDGTRLIITRLLPGGAEGLARSVVVPIDRSSAGVELDCPANAPLNDCTADWQWSPDDTALLGVRSGESAVMADPATGKIRPAPWTATGYPAWQRVVK
jgi:Tol biopolymer transport system component